MESTIYIVSGAALIFGALIAWFYAQSRNAASRRALEKELDLNRERLTIATEKLTVLENNLEEERLNGTELGRQLAVAGEKEKSLREQYELYKQEVEKLQEKFKLEFENIATKILKQNTLDFSESNQKNLNDVINPLRKKIEEFEKTVSDTYQKGLKDQVDLKAEIKNLHELNTRLSEEANNLTNALKSDSKKQGNWGEMVLEKLLERSGLTKGEEYVVQESYRNEKGELIRPDVIIKLPEDKHIIIDSKVSLKAYEQFVTEDNADKKVRLAKAHVDSVREHIKELAEKSYQLTEKLDTPDFVLLFMPLESAFSLAIQEQSDLFSFAWERKIVLVSPTTLLATLMTVGSIWKHEKQTRNALEIARQGGRLYDKFVSFLSDLETLGTQIERVQVTYKKAHNKLRSGDGNLIRRVKLLQELGAKTSKEIPPELLQEDNNEEND